MILILTRRCFKNLDLDSVVDALLPRATATRMGDSALKAIKVDLLLVTVVHLDNGIRSYDFPNKKRFNTAFTVFDELQQHASWTLIWVMSMGTFSPAVTP